MGLLVGTVVTLSLYILSNSALSVAAVPVIPHSFGNYTGKDCCKIDKGHEELTEWSSMRCRNLKKEVLIANGCQGNCFILYRYTFFCFNCLVKPITPSPPLTHTQKKRNNVKELAKSHKIQEYNFISASTIASTK